MMSRCVRKTIAIAVALLLTATAVFAAGFPDVSSDNWSWAKDTIEEMAAEGYILGYDDGNFYPGNTVTNWQALILASRVLGFNDEAYAPYVELATEKYEKALSSYNIQNKSEISFLLYLGVIKTSELSNYISPETVNAGMKREDAAVLFTKALGKEDEAKSKVMTVLSYADATEISADKQAYVQIATEEGIMQGTGDNMFSPAMEVNRAQMATMMQRVLKKLESTDKLFEGTVVSSDSLNGAVKVKDQDENTLSYSVSSKTVVQIGGESAGLQDFAVGDKVLVLVRTGDLIRLEKTGLEVRETLEGVVETNTIVNGVATISFLENGETKAVTYKAQSDCVVTRGGESGTIKSVQDGDLATIDVIDGVIVKIDAKSKNKHVVGEIEEIVLTPEVKVTILDEDGNSEVYELSEEHAIYKNGRVASFSDISVGDSISAQAEYNTLLRIDLTSTASSANGVIEEITIGATSYVKIKSGDQSISYPLKRTAEIDVNGSTGTVYDLRLNQRVEVSLESGTATKIKADSTIENVTITGVITLVNPNFNFVTMSKSNADGTTEDVQIFFTKDATMMKDNKSIKIDALKVGDVVSVFGTNNVGVFEASTLVVVSGNTAK